MIAPKIVSNVQPTGRDYSQNTSPDMVTDVPRLAPQCQAGVPRNVRTCPFCGADGVEPCTGIPSDFEAGRTTIGQALVGLIAMFLVGFLIALGILGQPDDSAYRGCLDAFRTEIGAVTAMDEIDCRDGVADGDW